MTWKSEPLSIFSIVTLVSKRQKIFALEVFFCVFLRLIFKKKRQMLLQMRRRASHNKNQKQRQLIFCFTSLLKFRQVKRTNLLSVRQLVNIFVQCFDLKEEKIYRESSTIYCSPEWRGACEKLVQGKKAISVPWIVVLYNIRTNARAQGVLIIFLPILIGKTRYYSRLC